jgi:hypothetical protein
MAFDKRSQMPRKARVFRGQFDRPAPVFDGFLDVSGHVRQQAQAMVISGFPGQDRDRLPAMRDRLIKTADPLQHIPKVVAIQCDPGRQGDGAFAWVDRLSRVAGPQGDPSPAILVAGIFGRHSDQSGKTQTCQRKTPQVHGVVSQIFQINL